MDELTPNQKDEVQTFLVRQWLGKKRRAKFERVRLQSRQTNVVLSDLRLIYRKKTASGEL